MNTPAKLLAGCVLACVTGLVTAADAPETILVTSSAFANHSTIPLDNTAYGANTSIDSRAGPDL
jgi:hypothetical protein